MIRFLLIVAVVLLAANLLMPDAEVPETSIAQQTENPKQVQFADHIETGQKIKRDNWFSDQELQGLFASFETQSISTSMDFNQCISRIESLEKSLGEKPFPVVHTDIARMVRWTLADGTFLVTCSKLDKKIVLTFSPL